MSTFNQMISRVQALVGSHALANSTVVGTLVNSRHRGLLESYDWSRRKQDIIVNSVADKTAGTVTLTSGSATVTGSGTAFAASDVGRTIQFADSLFQVRTYSSPTSITIGDANGTAVLYPGDTAVSGYTIFTQRYSVGTGIEQIVEMAYQNPITEVSEEWIDFMDSSRVSTATNPYHYARTSRGTTDDVRIELYPRPSSPITINVKVELGHTDLSSTQTPIVPSGPCEWFAATDACFFLYAKTKDNSWLQLAANYEKQAGRALEFELNQDMKKFGTIQAVRDVGSGIGFGGTDFALTHDIGE